MRVVKDFAMQLQILAHSLNDPDLRASQSCSRIFDNKCLGWITLRFMFLKRKAKVKWSSLQTKRNNKDCAVLAIYVYIRMIA